MNKKKLTKAIIFAACAMLLVVGTVMGTVAYLTSQVSVKNTFTYGNVTITMDEAKADGSNGRVTSNEYKLVPGANYTKNLQIHVEDGSEDCYLFVKIADAFATIDSGIVADLTGNGWKALTGVAGVYYYEKAGTSIVASSNSVQDITVISDFTVNTNATANDLDDFANTAGYEVIAYAVQASGFTGVADAWTVFAN